jgi:membrane protein implicated in regulation of membrane protease activity
VVQQSPAEPDSADADGAALHSLLMAGALILAVAGGATLFAGSAWAVLPLYLSVVLFVVALLGYVLEDVLERRDRKVHPSSPRTDVGDPRL